MNVVNGLKSGIAFVSQTLNQPIVKETVNKVVGVGHLAFGALAVYGLYNQYNDLKISLDDPWKETAFEVSKIAFFVGSICTGLTSQPGVFIASYVLGLAFSTPQLERIFGPNTIFVINPTHPRHIISIAGAILMAPATLHSLYEIGNIAYHKVSDYLGDRKSGKTFSFDNFIPLLIQLTTCPVLHLGNGLVSLIIAKPF